ncbi:Transmembrane protein 63C [Cyanidiococcus yangmingshanensis]|uniref:Transmembrane protein 63C n=1 Tax=Cyanidiococcus yangmingshanensis TaxID=2690220 RepID=A0A7J7IJN3_9RHOD|nr:Transmembrane protein 63C [Cyanidiococcus yangmingshanensis]
MLVTALSAYGLVVQMPLLVWLAGNHPTTPWLRSWWQRFRFAGALSAGLERGSRMAFLAQLPVWWAFSTAIGLWRLAQDQAMQSTEQLERPHNIWHNPEATAAAAATATTTTTATASLSYGTLAASASPAMVSPCRSTSLWVLLRGWPLSGWNTSRIKAALAMLYPPEDGA